MSKRNEIISTRQGALDLRPPVVSEQQADRLWQEKVVAPARKDHASTALISSLEKRAIAKTNMLQSSDRMAESLDALDDALRKAPGIEQLREEFGEFDPRDLRLRTPKTTHACEHIIDWGKGGLNRLHHLRKGQQQLAEAISSGNHGEAQAIKRLALPPLYKATYIHWMHPPKDSTDPACEWIREMELIDNKRPWRGEKPVLYTNPHASAGRTILERAVTDLEHCSDSRIGGMLLPKLNAVVQEYDLLRPLLEAQTRVITRF